MHHPSPNPVAERTQSRGRDRHNLNASLRKSFVMRYLTKVRRSATVAKCGIDGRFMRPDRMQFPIYKERATRGDVSYWHSEREAIAFSVCLDMSPDTPNRPARRQNIQEIPILAGVVTHDSLKMPRRRVPEAASPALASLSRGKCETPRKSLAIGHSSK